MSKARETVETLRTVLVDGDVTNANFTGADLEIGKGGTGASSAGAARTALGLVVGTDVLAPDGSAANLTNLPAGGAEDFVASGTLPNGSPVILKANGQVEVVAGSTSYSSTTLTTPIASTYDFSTDRAEYNCVSFDPSDATRFVICYRSGTSPRYGKAVVGTVSGESISFGTAANFTTGVGHMDANAISFDPNQSGRFVVVYSSDQGGSSANGFAAVGTRSGNSLTMGSEVEINTSGLVFPSIEFDPQTSGKFLVNWGDSSNKMVVGTLSTTTLSFGTAVVISASYNQPNLAVDPTNAGKYVTVYQDGADSDHGYAAVITVTGTTPSMGTPVKFLSSACVRPHVAYDSGVANAFVIAFVDNGDSNKAKAVAGVVSGTSLSFGTIITYNATSSASTYIAADPNNTGTFVATSDDGVGRATVIARTSTNTVTAGTSYVLYNGANTDGAIEFNSASSKKGQFVYVTEDRSASPYVGKAVIGQIASTLSTNLTATNFLGTATAAYTNGQTASIMLKGGISDNQTSLTAGSTYYVQPTGTFATTAGTPPVLAGKAVSATSLLLNGLDEIPSQSGNTGKFLTTNGSAASWGTTPPAGMTLLSTVIASGASTVDIETTFDSTYDTYIIDVVGMNQSTDSGELRLRMKVGGAYQANDSLYQTHVDLMNVSQSNNTYSSFNNDGLSYIKILEALGTQSYENANMTITTKLPAGTAFYKQVYWTGVAQSHGSSTSIMQRTEGTGTYMATSALTGIRIYPPSGTISGTFRLYGMAK